MSEADKTAIDSAASAGLAVGLELRVLSGIHVGARALLSGQAEFSIGAQPDNDIVLRDAPFARARITVDGARWTWLDDELGLETTLARAQALRAGELIFVLDEPGARWVDALGVEIGFERPSAPVLAQTPEADSLPTDGPESSESRLQSVDEAALKPSAGASTAHDEDAKQAIPEGSREGAVGRPRFMRPAVLVPGAAMVALALAVWTIGGDKLLRWMGERDAASPVVEAAQSAEPAPAHANEDDLERVNLAISTAGFADVARASIRSDGRILVQGVVENDEDQEALLRSLLVERKWLAFGLLTQSEFRARVRELRRSLPAGFQVSALPEGKIDLGGLALELDEIDRVRALVLREIPETSGILINVLTPDLAVARFSSQIRELGFETVRVDWTGERMAVEGSIPHASMGLWEQTLLRFNSLFGDRLPTRVALSLTEPPAIAAAAASSTQATAKLPPPPKLPRIVAVQSGARSYLMFADGNRLLPGGVINGFRLASIDDESLLFEDRTGYQHRIPR